MTGMEAILLFAVAVLTAHVVILQRHYTQKLSDQAMVLAFLVETLRDTSADTEKLDQLREIIFNSSQ